MKQSSDPPLYLGKRKLSKGRKSIDSWIDYEDDGSDFSEVEYHLDVPIRQQEASFEQKFDSWADALAQVFIRRRPKRYIDINEGFVSKEESEYRLLLLYLVCSCIICLITTSLLIVCPFYCNNQKIIYFKYESKEIQNVTRSLKVPHILVIYEDGRIIDISSNETLSPSKNITMQMNVDSHPFGGNWGYYAYADLQYVYVFDGKGKSDITYIDCSTFKHFTLAKSKLPRYLLRGMGVKVGDRFILTGGYLCERDHCNYGENHYGQVMTDHQIHISPIELFPNNKTISWSNKRSKYLISPKFRSALQEYTCLTSFNRTHFIMVNPPYSNGEVLMVNIETWMGTDLPRLPLPLLPHPFDYEDYQYGYHSVQQSRIACNIEFNNVGSKILTVIAKKHCKYTPGLSHHNFLEECNSPEDEISIMYQLMFDTMQWSNMSTSIQHFGSLAILNGIKYFINISNEEKVLGYFYEAKNDTWMQITKSQLDFSSHLEYCKEVGCKVTEPVVIVPYFETLLD